MKTNFKKVKEFHSAFLIRRSQTPSLQSAEVTKLRIDLIEEEVKELKEALEDNNIVEVADALGDILYVVYGMADVYGIDIDAVFAEIHESNMSKLDDNGIPIFREDGKILKGPNFKKPDLTKIVSLPLDND